MANTEDQSKKRRVYLIGYMGSGKSTIAKRLSALLNLPSYDLDTLFEDQYKIEIGSFFNRYDETLFRKLESSLLKDTVNIPEGIIATGGGTACFYDNIHWMNENGLTVYIRMSPVSIVERLKNSKKRRPLIANKQDIELLPYIQESLRHRNIFYSQAHLMVKGESLDVNELANKILEFLE